MIPVTGGERLINGEGENLTGQWNVGKVNERAESGNRTKSMCFCPPIEWVVSLRPFFVLIFHLRHVDLQRAHPCRMNNCARHGLIFKVLAAVKHFSTGGQKKPHTHTQGQAEGRRIPLARISLASV